MKFGLQHANYSFDYRNHDSSHILDSLKNLVISAETLGFDSFWVMDHFHQIPMVGKQDEPMLESWTTISVLAGITSKIKLGTMMTGTNSRYYPIITTNSRYEDFNSASKTCRSTFRYTNTTYCRKCY
jgi:alkanesulfonate monooxygenase SsuD/methylene tetrahydromethanopterin reductase-like flavin-dependent oxidoreductase (luciferase family)